jgi:hypothetical protein
VSGTAYEGLSRAARTRPTDINPRVRETLERLVQLYQALSRPAEAAEWERKLTIFDAAAVEPSPQSQTTNALAVTASKTERQP